MSNIIRIKRSETSGNPSTLGNGELAYSGLTDNGSNGGDRLYIGMGSETSGNAATHVVIGGKFFTDRLDHSAGTLTASSAIVVDSNKKIDDLFVDNIELNGNTISTTDTNGNLLLSPNGTGKVSIAGAYTLPRVDGTANYVLTTNGAGVVSWAAIPVSGSITIGSTSISLGATSTSLAGLTELTIDNLNFNGNIISSTNTNGDISLDPNGLGNVDVNGAKITNVGTPEVGSDAANKDYVDNAVTGLTWKDAANLLADSNVELTGTTGTLVIDGHGALTQAHGDGYRILLKNQSTASENGVYLYSDDGSNYTLSRSADADTYAELKGASIFILEGTNYGKSGWVQGNHYLTNFSGQQWVQFNGGGAYSGGDGLTLSGSTFIVNVATDGGIEIAADNLQLKSTIAGSGLLYSSGVLSVGDIDGGTY